MVMVEQIDLSSCHHKCQVFFQVGSQFFGNQIRVKEVKKKKKKRKLKSGQEQVVSRSNLDTVEKKTKLN